MPSSPFIALLAGVSVAWLIAAVLLLCGGAVGWAATDRGRAVLAGLGPLWVALPLVAAFVFHVADLKRRWRE